MKVQLKNVNFYESMSEETNCFDADLFINGKKVGYVRNDGRGGCTDYSILDASNRDIIKQAEEYFSAMPKKLLEGTTIMYQPTLENVIDDLFCDWLKIKEDKKFLTNMKTSLLFGSKENYTACGWKGITLEGILKSKNPSGIGSIKRIILEKKAMGLELLNTNIPSEYLT